MTRDSAELAVQSLVIEGVALAEIEGYVDELPLDGEHKSALWLLAWSRQTPPLVGASQARRSRTSRSARVSSRHETSRLSGPFS